MSTAPILVQRGTDAIRTFETLDRPDGGRVAPAALPTVISVHVNGVANSGLTPTVTQMQDAVPANITGYYRVQFPTASLAVNDDVDVVVQATIAGATRSLPLRFTIVDLPSMLPTIR